MLARIGYEHIKHGNTHGVLRNSRIYTIKDLSVVVLVVVGVVVGVCVSTVNSTYVAISAILPFCHSFRRTAIPAIPPFRHSAVSTIPTYEPPTYIQTYEALLPKIRAERLGEAFLKQINY